MYCRHHARKAYTEKQECTLKAVTVLVKDIDNWVNKIKEYDRVPDIDLIVEQHGLFKKRVMSAFNDDVFIDKPRDTKDRESKRMEKVLSPIRKDSRDDGASGEKTETAGKEPDNGNQPNVQLVTLLLSNESDLSYNHEEDSIFIKAGNFGFKIIIEKLNA